MTESKLKDLGIMNGVYWKYNKDLREKRVELEVKLRQTVSQTKKGEREKKIGREGKKKEKERERERERERNKERERERERERDRKNKCDDVVLCTVLLSMVYCSLLYQVSKL